MSASPAATAFPVDQVRARFPALSGTEDGRRRIFLDNPAGTQVPDSVIQAVADAYRGAYANLGGAFATSRRATAILEAARLAMADLLGAASPAEIVLGANMTTLTYSLSRALARDWGAGDELVVSRMDHEANVSPWLDVARDRGMTVRWLEFDDGAWQLEPARLAKLLTPRTRLVAFCMASNLLGSINPVADLAAVARSAGAIVYADAVQYAPHVAVDVAALGVDFLACSAYKLFGPHVGVVWGRAERLAALTPYRLRTAPVVPPGSLETGTNAYELHAGLIATVDYLAWLGEACGAAPDAPRRQRLLAGLEASAEYEATLGQALIDGLRALPGIRIIGISDHNRRRERVPTVSFTAASRSPQSIVAALADDHIFAWAGHNYAVEVVRQLGIPEDTGVVRLGLAHYNTHHEVEETLAALARIL